MSGISVSSPYSRGVYTGQDQGQAPTSAFPIVTPVGSSGGGTNSIVPPTVPSQPLNITAQRSPALEGLRNRYDKYLNDLSGGQMTGRIMDIAGSKARDIREGGRNALIQSEGQRGVASSPALAQYDAETARGQQAALADVATKREQMLGDAIRGGTGVEGAPEDMALREKGFGLQTWQAQNAANMDAFQAFMALLNAQRSSPAAGTVYY